MVGTHDLLCMWGLCGSLINLIKIWLSKGLFLTMHSAQYTGLVGWTPLLILAPSSGWVILHPSSLFFLMMGPQTSSLPHVCLSHHYHPGGKYHFLPRPKDLSTCLIFCMLSLFLDTFFYFPTSKSVSTYSSALAHYYIFPLGPPYEPNVSFIIPPFTAFPQ